MDVIMPQLGETVAEGVVTKWYKRVGDTVKADETLFDVETDKVSTEMPAPVSGVIAQILVQEGVTAKVGAALAIIDEGNARPAAPAARDMQPTQSNDKQVPAPASVARFSAAPAGDRLSPVVRRLVAEHKLNPAEISGSGRDGRITREDVLTFIARRPTQAASTPTQEERVTDSARRTDTRKPLSNIRKRTREHMVKSWTTAPHVLQAIEVDFMRVELARKSTGAAWKAREGYTLTYLPFIARAVSVALAKFPLLNASLDGDDLVVHNRINIGIAVDLNHEGLVVPVINDVPSKSLPQLARDINDIAQRARSNRLKVDELSGGTYTLSNSGVFGTLITAPIINQPQVAILSTDGVSKKPVVIESEAGDSIAIRPIGVLAQTFDHRAVDGAYSAAFLREVKTVIETRDWLQALNA